LNRRTYRISPLSHVIRMSEQDNTPRHVDSDEFENDTSESQSSSVCIERVEREMSLNSLFESVHHHPDNPKTMFEGLQPYIERATQRQPQSTLHKEILKFVNNQIEEESCVDINKSAKTQCTMAQVHAMVYVVNDNQFLLQDDGLIPPKLDDGQVTTESDLEYNVFMDEMAKL